MAAACDEPADLLHMLQAQPWTTRERLKGDGGRVQAARGQGLETHKSDGNAYIGLQRKKCNGIKFSHGQELRRDELLQQLNMLVHARGV
jgi:hypothetical protein